MENWKFFVLRAPLYQASWRRELVSRHLVEGISSTHHQACCGGALICIFVLLSGCVQSGYVGTDTCLACHNGQLATDMRMFTEGKHAEVGCEFCHGPGALHVRNGGRYGRFIDNSESVKEICVKCHGQETKEFLQSGHARNGILKCIDCHNPHDENQTVRTTEDNQLCLQCHAYYGFDTLANIVDHTYHAYDPELTGQSRCVICHMVPTDRIRQDGSRSHTLIPVPPVESNLAGVIPAPPNTCAGVAGCHDGSISTAPEFDVDTPAVNDYLQVLYETRYGN